MTARFGFTRSLLLRRALLVGALLVPALPGLKAGRALPSAPEAAGITLAGSVVDSNLLPLADVSVTLTKPGTSNLRAVSDAQGRFILSALSPGNYRLRAERSGFTPLARELHLPDGIARMRLPLVLSRPGDEQPTTVGQAPVPASVSGGVVGGVAPPPPPSMAATAQRAAPAGEGAKGRGGAPLLATDETFAVSDNRLLRAQPGPGYLPGIAPQADAERYAHVAANRFERTTDRPLSTFGADVDTASFTNVRRFLTSGRLPPTDAVRVEELVNYFKFDYATPRGSHPIGLTTEMGDAPWAPDHKLVLIGARAVAGTDQHTQGRNLVLLIDVSGSMATPDKLPLLKTALNLFVNTLSPDDRLAIVTYAGSSGVALPSTPARQRNRILDAINGLGAAGSTNGGQGILVAYRTARQAFVPGGVNRVILATDGDFNVGVVSQRDLLQLIEREKESGIFLSVLGVGTGNLKDSTMEMLADKGNGHYAYLDSLDEARRVLVREADATLETVAKEVKFQVEFNPAKVAAWKLIGYENRRMAAEDFNNDVKDGGEMGAGHTLTVLYEVIPVGVPSGTGDGDASRPRVDPLRYQAPSTVPAARTSAPPAATRTDEWMTVKVRYQLPEGDTSRLLEQSIRGTLLTARAEHLPFAAAAAEFGLLLRDSRATPARWDTFARRLSTLKVAPGHVTDLHALGELAELARALNRVR